MNSDELKVWEEFEKCGLVANCWNYSVFLGKFNTRQAQLERGRAEEGISTTNFHLGHGPNLC